MDSDSDQSLDRIIVINPLTQSMTVIGVNSTDFDSVVSELMNNEGQPPASEAAIGSLPEVEVKSEDVESLGGECVICLEEWGVGDVAKVMPCQHKFHSGCVEKWLRVHGSCPVCRYKMDLGNRKIGGESGTRRRDIWVTLAVATGNHTSYQDEESQEP